jgi:hypothetical protein
MNTTPKKLKARFAPETRFEVPPAPFRAVQATELENLKARLLRQMLAGVTDPARNIVFRRAANEAAALAWLTTCPLLLFPVLLEEKARAATLQAGRQRRVMRRSANLLLEAA